MADLRALRPNTPEDVCAVLREALDEAVTGNVRGIVVLLRYNDGRGYRHATAGEVDLGDALVMLEAWKWTQLAKREAEKRETPSSG